LRFGTRRADFHYHAAAIAASRGDAGSACAHLSQMLGIDPRFAAPAAGPALPSLCTGSSEVTRG